jgi:hypothetical protein
MYFTFASHLEVYTGISVSIKIREISVFSIPYGNMVYTLGEGMASTAVYFVF